MLESEKTEIVLGPPGTGKTHALLSEVESSLARGVRPDRIAYLSFTRRAAEEAVSRACERFKLTRDEFPYFRTIHSLCYRFLGLSSSDVFDSRTFQEFSEYVGVTMTGRLSSDGTLAGFSRGDRIMFMENLARTRCLTLREQFAESDDGLPWYEVDRVARAYREFKQDMGLVDYTDMLLEFTRVGASPPLDEIYVDEGQDLSRAQWGVVAQLARTCRRVVVAGDDDQAIYRWAGADVDAFVDLRGRSRVLNQSWRVPQRVMELALAPIREIRHRRPKEWRARAAKGSVTRVNDFQYADLSGDDVLILARNEYVIAERVEPVLKVMGVLYEKRGMLSVRQGAVDSIVLWERLRRGESVTAAEARSVTKRMTVGRGCTRECQELPGVDDEETVTLDLLKGRGLLTDAPWFDALTGLSSGEVSYIKTALQQGEKISRKPRVRVSTIHGSKGGQADHVILMTEMAARTWREMSENPDDERRVWYVAMTRAKEQLTTVDSETRRQCLWIR